MNHNIRILRVNNSGQPLEWLTWQDAATLYCQGRVAWTLGQHILTVKGGISRLFGIQSCLDIHSIIASSGKVFNGRRKAPPLTNRALFQRDQGTCMYCGSAFGVGRLTRDHVVPLSRGGEDSWTNVVAACKACNQKKGSFLLENISMKLLALPYCPNTAEYLALTNSNRILADQMDFLKTQFSKNCRLE